MKNKKIKSNIWVKVFMIVRHNKWSHTWLEDLGVKEWVLVEVEWTRLKTNRELLKQLKIMMMKHAKIDNKNKVKI